MTAVTLDEWKKKLESPNREIIILHNPKVRRAGDLCADQQGHPFGSLEGLALHCRYAAAFNRACREIISVRTAFPCLPVPAESAAHLSSSPPHAFRSARAEGSYQRCSAARAGTTLCRPPAAEQNCSSASAR